MRMLMALVTGVLLAVPVLGQTPAGQAGTSGSQKPDPAIAKVADAYVAAVNARDAAKIAELYTEDAVEMPPNRKPLKGRAAIREYYQQMFKGEMGEFSDFRLQRIASRTVGEIGYEAGQYSQRVTPKANGKPIDDTGNYIVILHQMQGQWRVAYAIYNSHTPEIGQPATKTP